jgi:hypothetical protein
MDPRERAHLGDAFSHLGIASAALADAASALHDAGCLVEAQRADDARREVRELLKRVADAAGGVDR